MGVPAVVLGDAIKGSCPNHMIPGAFGVPQPVPAMPFNAPLLQQLSITVLIMNKPAAVVGSSGLCIPPHVGLHPSDPFLAPPLQQGLVVSGSATVFFDGKPAAKTGSSCTMCLAPGQLVGTASTVLVGG